MQWKLLFTSPCPLNDDISIVRILKMVAVVEWSPNSWSDNYGNSRVQGFLGSRVSRVCLGFSNLAATAYPIGASNPAE